jgi:hypothetical protein
MFQKGDKVKKKVNKTPFERVGTVLRSNDKFTELIWDVDAGADAEGLDPRSLHVTDELVLEGK